MFHDIVSGYHGPCLDKTLGKSSEGCSPRGVLGKQMAAGGCWARACCGQDAGSAQRNLPADYSNESRSPPCAETLASTECSSGRNP